MFSGVVGKVKEFTFVAMGLGMFAEDYDKIDLKDFVLQNPDAAVRLPKSACKLSRLLISSVNEIHGNPDVYIPIPNMDGALLLCIGKFCERHQFDSNKESYNLPRNSDGSLTPLWKSNPNWSLSSYVSPDDTQLIEDTLGNGDSKGIERLFSLMVGALVLRVPKLTELCSLQIARMMTGASSDQIRTKFFL